MRLLRLLRPRVLFAGLMLLLELPVLAPMVVGAVVTWVGVRMSEAWQRLRSGGRRASGRPSGERSTAGRLPA